LEIEKVSIYSYGICRIDVGIPLLFKYFLRTAQLKDIVYVSQSNIVKHVFDVEGMTCAGCEAHVESEVDKLDGILSVKASYESANTEVEYDKTKVDLAAIRKAINSTGYKVIDTKNKENK